jgi:hypothetical protein
MSQISQQEKTAELEKSIAIDKGKSDLIEKLVFILFPICVSAIGWLLTQVNSLSDNITVLNNKVNIVVNAENKAIPPQGTTIELEQLRASAMQARADMKMDINEKITNIQIGAMQERADIKARLSVVESRLNNHK